MSVFGSRSDGDQAAYVTAEQAQGKVDELIAQARREFITRDDASAHAEALAALDRRVTELEALARQMRRTSNPTTAAPAPLPRRDPITGGSLRAERPVDTTESVSQANGVDYGAIAFGLSEIKRKIASALPGTMAGNLAHDYAGAVQYFADVFAKSDPTFDSATFKRQSDV
jgi:hypothetical protein